MRVLYPVLLIVMAVGCAAAFRLEHRIYRLRTQSTVVASPAAVAAIIGQRMPAEATEVGSELERLAELGQDDYLVGIRQYASQQRLAEALGESADTVATLAAARDWQRAHPERVAELAGRLVREGIGIALAAPDVAPPDLGRGGFYANTAFTAAGDGLWRALPSGGATATFYVVVVNVRNRLHLPLTAFSFAVRASDSAAADPWATVPAGSLLWCEEAAVSVTRSVPPQATVPVTCDLRIPFLDRQPVEVLHRLLGDLRQSPLQPWVRRLGAALPDSARMSSVQVTDHGVDAATGHGPSARVEAGFHARTGVTTGPPPAPRRLTSCADRGDCARVRLMPFEGIVDSLAWLLALLLPGYVVAGLSRLRADGSHVPAVLLFAVLALVVVTSALREGGNGYGPIIAAFLLAYATAGFWTGYALGRRITRPHSPAP